MYLLSISILTTTALLIQVALFQSVKFLVFVVSTVSWVSTYIVIACHSWRLTVLYSLMLLVNWTGSALLGSSCSKLFDVVVCISGPCVDVLGHIVVAFCTGLLALSLLRVLVVGTDTFNHVYEGFKGYHYNANIIKGVYSGWCVEDFVNCKSNYLVDWLLFVMNLVIEDWPYNVMHFLGWQLVKDSIRACQHVVKFFATVFRVVDFWITNDHVWIASKLWLLGFKISKCSTNRKSAWEHSIWSDQRVIHCVLISRWLGYPDLLQAWLTFNIYNTMRLVDMPTRFLNPVEFSIFTWFVIIAQV